MTFKRLLVLVALAALPTGCVLPFGAADPPGAADQSGQSLLQEFFAPESAEQHLQTTMTNVLGLEGVHVDYQDQVIEVAFEMPDGLSTGQSMLLFTTLLDLAARYAPFSQTIELAIRVGGEPFYTLVTDTEAVVEHRTGKISASDLVRSSRLQVSETEPQPPPATESTPEVLEFDPVELRSNIPVLASALHADPYENWSIIGALGNNNDVVVSAVQVAYQVMDAGGAIIHEGQEQIPQYRMAPGEGSAFSIYVPTAGNPPASFELAVTDATYDPSNQELPALKMSDIRILPGQDGQSAVLVGTLHNPYTRTVTLGTVTAIGVDASGLPLSAATYGAFPWSLASEASSPFSLTLGGMSPEELAALDDAFLYSDGWFTAPTAASTLQLSRDTRYFRATDGSSHIVGSAVNTGSRPWTGRLLGVLYDAQGSILDVALGYVPGDPVAPDLQLTFDISDFHAQYDLIAEQAARFEVIADSANVSDEMTVEATPLVAEITRVEAMPDAARVEAVLAPFGSDFEDVVYWVNLWSSDRKVLYGTRGSSFSPSEIQGGTISEYVVVDPATYDPSSVLAEILVYGLQRSP